MKEYATTYGEYARGGVNSEPDAPCPPPGNGWRLVAMTAAYERLFWAWERDNISTSSPEAKERKRCLDIVAAVSNDWSDSARVSAVLNDLKQRVESGM